MHFKDLKELDWEKHIGTYCSGFYFKIDPDLSLVNFGSNNSEDFKSERFPDKGRELDQNLKEDFLYTEEIGT